MEGATKIRVGVVLISIWLKASVNTAGAFIFVILEPIESYWTKRIGEKWLRALIYKA